MTAALMSSIVFTAAVAPAADCAIGADLSFLREVEERGTVFRDEGVAKPVLKILKDHGYQWIRLRLFHTPSRLPNDLDYTIASAQAARDKGFKFLLNFHYSDTWADPQKQIMPKAWEGKTHMELVDAVFVWWEPAANGRLRNRGFFDDGNAPPVITVFDRYTRH